MLITSHSWKKLKLPSGVFWSFFYRRRRVCLCTCWGLGKRATGNIFDEVFGMMQPGIDLATSCIQNQTLSQLSFLTFPIGGLVTSSAKAAAKLSVFGICVGTAVSINCCCCCWISPSNCEGCCTCTCSRTYCICGSKFSCCSIKAIWPPAICTTCKHHIS